jgi:hypothetical protein
MQELINRLTEKAGVTTEQASKSIEAIKEFVKEKFPMMAGAVDNLFAAQTPAATGDSSAPSIPSPGMMDKISDIIPGETGQKLEDFAKNAANKAEDLFDNAKEKLGGVFGGNKN